MVVLLAAYMKPNLKKLTEFINPLSRLGKTTYSFWVPFIANIIICAFSEIYSHILVSNPEIVNSYIVLINIIAVLYFSFRDGIKGGIITTVASSIYYAFIIYSHRYTGSTYDTHIYFALLFTISFILISLVVGGLKQIADIYIQRETDEKKRLEVIIRQLPIGVIVTDNMGKVVMVNDQVKEILGKAVPIGHIVGQDQPVVPSKHSKKLITKDNSPLLLALKERKETHNLEATFEEKEKGKRFIKINAVPVIGAKNRVIAAVGTIVDITKEKLLDEQRNDFINMASHELKTPLTSAKVFTHVLQQKITQFQDKDAKMLAGKINTQLSKITLLVLELLDVTNLQKGKLKIEKKRVLIRNLAEDVIDDLNVVSEHKIILDWHTAAYVMADTERIRQVLSNLISNAIKYSPSNSEIILSSRQAGDYVEIGVKDFGIGIPKNQQRYVFDKFYQVKEKRPSSSATYPGLGLGLYISSQIIKQHGGKMRVESAKGKGSTFYFTLPIAEEGNV